MIQSPSARRRLASAAVAVLLGSASNAFCQFAAIDTFQANDPGGGPYSWNNTLNWTSAAIPSATTLVRFPSVVGAVTMDPAGLAVYGLDLNADTGSTAFSTSGGGPLILTSLESIYDPANNHAPAINITSVANGTLSLRGPVQLGNGSVSSGIAYVINDTPGNTVQLAFDRVTQAPGTTMGITFTGPGLSALRAATGSGNYLINRWDITGQITVARNVAAGTNARMYVFNNILPYGVGLPNLQLDGSLVHQHNGNALLLNSIDSTYDTALISRVTNGTDVAVGANGLDGSWAGRISTSTTSLYKIGDGVQALGNGTNAHARTTLMEGVISVSSIGNVGVNSNLGSSTIVFDGGTLRYTGAGNSSDREVQIGFRGATIESSGTGALVLSGNMPATDLAYAFGDNVASGTSQFVTNMYGIKGLGALAAAGSLQISAAGVGLTNVVGTFPVSVDETARTMELAPGSNNGTPGNGFGAPRITFTTSVGVERSLNLSGSNAADNTISSNLTNSGLAGQLRVSKSGTGKWVLSGANAYTGATIVNGGTLQLSLNAHAPVLPGTGTAAFADVRAGSIVFDYTGGSSVDATVLGILDAGFDLPTKFSSGQIRSTTVTPAIGLGWKHDAGLSQVTVKRTYYGDTNLDGQVDITDLAALATAWQTSGVWVNGDFDYSGFIDITDLAALATNWQAGVGAPLAMSFEQALAGVGLGGTVVPEPAALGLLAVGAAAVSRRRRA